MNLNGYDPDKDFDIERIKRTERLQGPILRPEVALENRLTFNQQMRLLSRAMGGNIESREIADGVYQHAAKETPMQWTKEYPRRLGLYWVRNLVLRRRGEDSRIEAPQIVEIDESGDICFIGDEVPALPAYRILSAEWYGPIEPPE